MVHWGRVCPKSTGEVGDVVLEKYFYVAEDRIETK